MTDKRLIQIATVLLAALMLQLPALAQDESERVGYFDVRSASTTLNNGVHELDARLQLILSAEALEALNSSVAMTIELRIEVIRVRRFYLDDVEAEVSFRLVTVEECEKTRTGKRNPIISRIPSA